MVQEVLPNAMYKVRLTEGRIVRAGVAPALRHAVVRLIAGDKVQVKLSSHDPSRGHIITKRPSP
jgi:translation initiation factor IF-1